MSTNSLGPVDQFRPEAKKSVIAVIDVIDEMSPGFRAKVREILSSGFRSPLSEGMGYGGKNFLTGSVSAEADLGDPRKCGNTDYLQISIGGSSLAINATDESTLPGTEVRLNRRVSSEIEVNTGVSVKNVLRVGSYGDEKYVEALAKALEVISSELQIFVAGLSAIVDSGEEK